MSRNLRRDTQGLGGIQHALNNDAAFALGIAGRRLRAALDALAQCAPGDPGRGARLAEAGEALWAYVVQKEALNLGDHNMLERVYRVPREVWKAMGPRSKA